MKNTPTLILEERMTGWRPAGAPSILPTTSVRRSMYTIDRSAEARLVETLGDLREQCDSWSLITFHFNDLLEENRSDYQLKIAVNLMNDLLRSYEGAIFMLADGSVAVLCNHIGTILANKLIFQLRYLYMDDPLAYNDTGIENAAFSTTYRLAHQWQEAMEFGTRAMMRASRRQKEIPGRQQSFDASRLVEVERELARTDIQPAIRRQPICATTKTGAIRQVFDEVYINIGHLRQLLKVKADIHGNKWLFKYLTCQLDERVLTLIKSNRKQYLSQPVSININVETLLSKTFTDFDAVLDPNFKVAVVFEIPLTDVFADTTAFHAARKAAQKLGYRICLDGLTAESFPHVNREQLGVDLLKLQWNAEVGTDSQDAASRTLASSILTSGAGRVILCRCDTRAAVEYGQALGISLFQGRYLDSLLNPASKVEN